MHSRSLIRDNREMRHRLLLTVTGLIAAGVLLVGCTAKEEPAPATTEPTAQVAPDATRQGGQGGVQVHGAGAGIVAPVTGTENLQGGGGGVNQAAKDRAKQAAGRSGSSLDQLPSDGE